MEERLSDKFNKQYSLHISRIPKNVLDRFYEIASEDDFCKDYGMALAYLIKVYDGLVPKGWEPLEEKYIQVQGELDLLKEKISVLENRHREPEVEKKPAHKMLDGKVRQ